MRPTLLQQHCPRGGCCCCCGSALNQQQQPRSGRCRGENSAPASRGLGCLLGGDKTSGELPQSVSTEQSGATGDLTKGHCMLLTAARVQRSHLFNTTATATVTTLSEQHNNLI